MKILVVVHGFPPGAQGGAEIYAEAQAHVLAESHGDDVLVLTREADPLAPEYRVRHEARQRLHIVWINNTFSKTPSFFDTYANASIRDIGRQVVEEFEPDVAHIHHLTCLSTAIVDILAEHEIPRFFTLHDYWLLCHRGQLLDRSLHVCAGPEPNGCDLCLDEAAGVGSLGFSAAAAFRTAGRWLPAAPLKVVRRAGRRLAHASVPSSTAAHEAGRRLEHMRHVAGQVTHFLAPSNHFRQRFRKFGIASDRITHAPYGVDHRPFREITRSSSNRLRLGFLGSLMVSKAPHLLLEAYRTLEPGSASVDLFGAPVDYHGDDSYRRTLAPLLEQDGVRLRGPVAHDRIPETLSQLDVLVVPSIWPENSPLVIHEAFLAGVPVVASRIGGIPELVTDGRTGLLFEVGDVPDLARALTRLIAEPELLPALRRGIPTIRTIEDDVATTRQLYASSLAPSAARTLHDAERHDRIAAVVLNYGTPDDTVLTVRSLLASRQPFDQIIVVDNHGSDGCSQALAPLAGRITYMQTERNLGFSGGMNVGIRHALDGGATSALLVNSDVIVPPDCLGALRSRLRGEPEAGIAGPVIRVRSQPDRVASLGMSYRATTGRMRHTGFGRVQVDDVTDATVDAVSGCVMLVTREVFDTIGLLDDDYFFSFEDLDFCLRARSRGFVTVLAGKATVYHEGSRSLGPASVDRLYYAARNHLLVASRTEASRGRSLSRGLTIAMLNLAHAVRFRGGSLPSRLAAVMEGTVDFLRGRFGPR